MGEIENCCRQDRSKACPAFTFPSVLGCKVVFPRGDLGLRRLRRCVQGRQAWLDTHAGITSVGVFSHLHHVKNPIVCVKADSMFVVK